MDHILKIPTGLDDPATWVLVALLLFLALLVYLKVPGMIAKALDDRAKAIQDELDAAKRLREEAAELLATYRRRQREAEREAEGIIAQAKRDAERMTATLKSELAERIERRAALAERKIAQAEADAARAVRAEAADAARAAAEVVLHQQLDAGAQAGLLDQSLARLGAGLRGG